MSGSELDYSSIAQLVGVLMAAGLFAGFVAGLFGIGGGFVVVPALLVVFSYFGVDSEVVTHVAIGTSLATIIVTSLRSMYAHHKRGAVDFKIIRDWAPWLVVGVGMGIVLAQYMDGRSLKWIFAIGVFLMGIHFIMPVLKNVQVSDEMPKGFGRASLASFLGGFSALLGIGGGTIAVLTMTMCGRPIHQAVATAAGFGVIIAVPGAFGFALLGYNEANLPYGSFGYVNVIAVVAITAMTFITAPLGARAAHSLNAAALKRVFGVYLVATSAIVLQNTFSG
ncbi:MAG: sulfite exporter TauE/SafE family protein [Pseudomonadota bacterium]